MKKIDRKTFEDLLRVGRKYRRTGDADILAKKHYLCEELGRNTGVHWIVFADLTSSFSSLNITNEQANKVMNMLGFELIDWSEENEQSNINS